MPQEPETAEVFRRITVVKAAVLRELADGWNEREAGERLGEPYATVRAQVAGLTRIVGLSSVRELGCWWREQRGAWVMFMVAESGARPHEIDQVREKRTNRI